MLYDNWSIFDQNIIKIGFHCKQLIFFSFYELDFMIIWILLGINENVDRTNWASVGIHDMQI